MRRLWSRESASPSENRFHTTFGLQPSYKRTILGSSHISGTFLQLQPYRKNTASGPKSESLKLKMLCLRRAKARSCFRQAVFLRAHLATARLQVGAADGGQGLECQSKQRIHFCGFRKTSPEEQAQAALGSEMMILATFALDLTVSQCAR